MAEPQPSSPRIDSHPPEVTADVAGTWYGRQQAGPRGFTRTIPSASTGVQLRSFFWPAQGEAKAIVQVVHGHGSYTLHEILRNGDVGKPSEYEGSWAQRLNAAGFSVCGADHIGHGFSDSLDGTRCFFRKFEDLPDDATAFAQSLREQADDLPASFGRQLPIFLLAASMGGAVAVHAMHNAPRGLLAGAVLLAPMLSLERVSRAGWNPYLQPVSALLTAVVPAAQLVSTNKSPINKQLQLEFENDPLTYTARTRLRVASEYLRTTREIAASLPRFDFPFLAFHSERDTMCDPDGTKDLFRLSQSEDKALRLVNTMWHALIKEQGEEEVLQHTIDWLAARAVGGNGGTGSSGGGGGTASSGDAGSASAT